MSLHVVACIHGSNERHRVGVGERGTQPMGIHQSRQQLVAGAPHPASAAPAPCRCRLRSLADGQEDVDAKMRLRRLFRSLQGVDDEVTRYNAMLAKFLDAKEDEWEAIVAVYRGDLQKAFFEHMQVGVFRVGGGAGRGSCGCVSCAHLPTDCCSGRQCFEVLEQLPPCCSWHTPAHSRLLLPLPALPVLLPSVCSALCWLPRTMRSARSSWC